jgi:ribonuclease P protein component
MPKFPKSERLRNKIVIQKLFKSNDSHYLYPFRLLYLNHSQPSATYPEVIISVSKRNFKKAVHRNWIKRRIREVYRLHKDLLADENGSHSIACLAIIYIAKEKLPYRELEKKILRLFERFRQ